MDKTSSASKSKKAASPRPAFPGDSPGKDVDIGDLLDKDDLSRKKSSSPSSRGSIDSDKGRRDSYYGDFGHKTKNKTVKRKGAYQGHDRTDKIY